MELAGSYWQVLLAGLVAIYSLGSSSSVVQEHLTSIQKVLGSIPSWVPFFFGGGGGFLYSLRKLFISKSLRFTSVMFLL